MDYSEPASPFWPDEMLSGGWYLKGYADAYAAHWAVIPNGPAGEHYKKGYAEGLAAVQREFFAAAYGPPVRIEMPSEMSIESVLLS